MVLVQDQTIEHKTIQKEYGIHDKTLPGNGRENSPYSVCSRGPTTKTIHIYSRWKGGLEGYLPKWYWDILNYFVFESYMYSIVIQRVHPYTTQNYT